MARTLKRLAGPVSISGAAATRYTVPASTTAVIRHMHFDNTTAGALTITVSIGADAAATELFTTFSIAANSVLDHFCLYVLTAAEILQAGASGAITMTVDGEEITLG